MDNRPPARIRSSITKNTIIQRQVDDHPSADGRLNTHYLLPKKCNALR